MGTAERPGGYPSFGYRLRKLEQRVRDLEVRLTNPGPQAEHPERERPDVRGSKS